MPCLARLLVALSGRAACGPTGVPGTGGPGRPRPPDPPAPSTPAALCCLLPRQISGRRAACPPARRPRCELRSARRLEARPGPAGLAAASNRSGCLCVARPGPATAHRHRIQTPPLPPAPFAPVVLAAIAWQFRMQFPDVCGPLLYEMPGISTLAGCRVKCLWRNCMRMCVDQDVPWPACIRNLSRETGVAFARAGRASDETAIAFAGDKWAFLVQFSGAEVSSVSTLAIQGCAVVMVVSRWSASAVAEV